MASGTDSDLGNMSAGMSSVMYGMITLLNGETVDREGMYDLIENLQDAIGDPEIVKRLIWNMSNYFTTNGSVYGTLNTTNTDVTRISIIRIIPACSIQTSSLPKICARS